jgi:hypothetical protein
MTTQQNHPIFEVALTEAGQATESFDRIQAFLSAYGYLDDDSFERGLLDERTSAALTSYQRFHALEITGTFDASTREMMTQPRCALPDPSPAAFSVQCAWPLWQLTFSYGTGTQDIAFEFHSVARALRHWQEVGPVTFTNTFATIPYWTGDNFRFDWVPGTDGLLQPEPGKPPPVAYAGLPPACTIFTTNFPQPVRFNDDYEWDRTPDSGQFDVESVALHEIGHILGLGHSMVPTAVMFPALAKGAHRRHLTPDDIAGLHTAYPHEGQWRWCRKCQGLSYGPNQAFSRCSAGGSHDGANSGNYILSAGPPSSNVWVSGWRHCNKCQGLYDLAGANSRCPAGGGHAPVPGANIFNLYIGLVQGPAQQDQWSRCSKCAGLFFGPFQANSRCPAAGVHAADRMYSLAIRWVPSGPTIY